MACNIKVPGVVNWNRKLYNILISSDTNSAKENAISSPVVTQKKAYLNRAVRFNLWI